MNLALILLCIAVILMSAPGVWPLSPNTAAFVLAIIALVAVCVGGVHVGR